MTDEQRTSGEEQGPRKQPARELSADERVDEASAESFPASDPPSFEPLHAGTPARHANGSRE